MRVFPRLQPVANGRRAVCLRSFLGRAGLEQLDIFAQSVLLWLLMR
jgi:hypothetical protein